jgi:hypothetical protein
VAALRASHVGVLHARDPKRRTSPRSSLYSAKPTEGFEPSTPVYESAQGRKRMVMKGPRKASMPCKSACSEIRIGNRRTRGFST